MSEIVERDEPTAMNALMPKSVANTVTINGEEYALVIDTRTTLLDLLRERINHPGTKKGCDHGVCGACTVSVNGERIVSCLTLAASVSGSEVLTVEGISKGDDLSELQQSFLREHARGDLSMVSYEGSRREVVGGKLNLSEHEIRERMAGNLCRCGAYANIVAAVRAVAERGH
jgi:xanthine dehydrogenase YagT iron-sulfur-binding subunit